MEIKGIGLKPKNMKKIISIFLLIIITFFLFNEFDKVKESSLRVIHKYSLRLSKNTAPKVYSFCSIPRQADIPKVLFSAFAR